MTVPRTGAAGGLASCRADGPNRPSTVQPRSGKPAASATFAEAMLAGSCRYVGTIPRASRDRAACATSRRATPRPRAASSVPTEISYPCWS